MKQWNCSKQLWNVISWEIRPCSLWELFQCSLFSPLAMNWHPTESFVEWTKVWINFYNPQKWGFQSSSSPCTNMPNSPCQYGIGPIVQNPVRVKTVQNKAKAISAELLELNLKSKLEETGKTRWTGRNRKAERKKTPKTGRNWMILKETGRNRKKQE